MQGLRFDWMSQGAETGSERKYQNQLYKCIEPHLEAYFSRFCVLNESLKHDSRDFVCPWLQISCHQGCNLHHEIFAYIKGVDNEKNFLQRLWYFRSKANNVCHHQLLSKSWSIISKKTSDRTECSVHIWYPSLTHQHKLQCRLILLLIPENYQLFSPAHQDYSLATEF